MKALLVAAFAVFMIAGCFEPTTASIEKIQYQKTRSDLVIRFPGHSQFCYNFAAYVLIGQWEMAEQYDRDFGDCGRNLVKRANNL